MMPRNTAKLVNAATALRCLINKPATKPPSVELSLAVPSLGYCKSMDELKSKLVAQLGRK